MTSETGTDTTQVTSSRAAGEPRDRRAAGTAHDTFSIRKAAAEHGIDERTLRKFLAGGKVRGVAGERCARAKKSLRAKP